MVSSCWVCDAFDGGCVNHTVGIVIEEFFVVVGWEVYDPYHIRIYYLLRVDEGKDKLLFVSFSVKIGSNRDIGADTAIECGEGGLDCVGEGVGFVIAALVDDGECTIFVAHWGHDSVDLEGVVCGS